MTVVSNASPLIALSRAGLLTLVRDLFVNVSVSEEVFAEVVTEGKPGAEEIREASWIHIEPVKNRETTKKYHTRPLSYADATVISLSKEKKADWVLVDEPDMREILRNEGLNCAGTVGILLMAKENGLIQSVKEEMDKLMSGGLRIGKKLYQQVLQDAGEQS